MKKICCIDNALNVFYKLIGIKAGSGENTFVFVACIKNTYKRRICNLNAVTLLFNSLPGNSSISVISLSNNPTLVVDTSQWNTNGSILNSEFSFIDPHVTQVLQISLTLETPSSTTINLFPILITAKHISPVTVSASLS